MTEVFKPRENMVYNEKNKRWECCDENGCLICDGGPSIIYFDGLWGYLVTGVGLHRLDGPVSPAGSWFIHGYNITYEIHAFAKENNIDLDNLSDEDKVMIALKFG